MHIYFMGICGTAMGNLALLLKKCGHTVSGADKNTYPPMSTLLQRAGIPVRENYDSTHLKKLQPDLVVVGNVITRGHPEMEWLLATQAFPYTSLPQLLREQILQKRRNVVVTGTHGKTTTASLIAFLLKKHGKDPGYFIGGVPKDFSYGASLGTLQDPFVIEGDEYDCAFFDKRSKFIHYLPSVLTINNLELDHVDIFRDLEDLKRSFQHLLRIVPGNGIILLNGDDPNIATLFPISWAPVLRVGVGKKNDVQIQNFSESSSGSQFELFWKNEHWSSISWPLIGIANARNAAMAALATASALELDPTELSLKELKSFRGVCRRQEILFKNEEKILLEDFAHHPTSIRQTLQSLRNCYPSHTLFACFEPRSNTLCSDTFQEALSGALATAQRVLIGAPPREKKVTLDREALCKTINLSGKSTAQIFETNAALLQKLQAIEREGQEELRLYCFLSNGAFDGIIASFKTYVAGSDCNNTNC